MDLIFEAVLESDETVAQLLKRFPELSQALTGEDHLVETIPHWLYVGDTPLHMAAAALRWGREASSRERSERERGKSSRVICRLLPRVRVFRCKSRWYEISEPP